MEYFKELKLKDGRTLILRNGTEQDGKAVLENFNAAHAETDFLLSYPDENSFTVEQEAEFLKEKTGSANEIEIVAWVDGAAAGTAGIEAIGKNFKVKHRAEFGISVLKEFWGLGIGRALTEACIECAEKAEYAQLELSVVAENERAITLYKKAGFLEFGRNPKGFYSRNTKKFQELVAMRRDIFPSGAVTV